MRKKKVRLTYVSDLFKEEFTVGKEYEVNDYKIISDTGEAFYSTGIITEYGYLEGFAKIDDDDEGIKAVVI